MLGGKFAVSLTFVVSLAFAALSSGCDQGARDDASGHGPALHLVASYPADGQGTNAELDAPVTCARPTPDCPVPTNTVIELRFDRFLRPGSGLAAGLSLYSGNPPANGIALRAEYDLIERVVIFRPTRALQPNTLYTAEVIRSPNPSSGFWAFDRAPLEEGAVPLSFSFTTGNGPVVAPVVAPRIPDTCETMTQGPFGTCVNCHSSHTPDDDVDPLKRYPPLGLDLATQRGLFYTAIGHVAHQSETGDTAANASLETPARFGVQMNVVDPGNPATSYLMYKLLQKPENFQLADADCVTGYHSPVSDTACSPPDADETARLREWFVRGDPMPKNGRNADTGEPVLAATTRANLVRIAGWIADGANCAEPQ